MQGVKPSERIAKIGAELSARPVVNEALREAWVCAMRIEEIAKILDERHIPYVTDSVTALTTFVELFDGLPPKERATLMVLLNERYSRAGDRR